MAPPTEEPFKVKAELPSWTYYNPLAWFILGIDTMLIVLSFGWTGLFKPRSYKVIEGPGGTVRNPASARGLLTEFKGCSTAWELAERSISTYTARRCMGTRRYLGTYNEAGWRFPKQMFGAVEWTTYADVGNRATAFGRGLIEMGMVALPGDEGRSGGTDFEKTTAPHTLLIYEETCAEWMTALVGAFSQSLCVATSYATLGISSVADAVVECNVKVILCNYKDVAKVAAAVGDMPTLTHIVYTTNRIRKQDAGTPPQTPGSKVTVLSFDEACGLSAEGPTNPPTPDNMAVIMYTSGSTGKPKGVMIRQKNLAASVAAMGSATTSMGFVEGEETYLAYLPAAHILELVLELTCFSIGSQIGFADPKTISSKGACRMDEATGIIHQEILKKYPANNDENLAAGAIQCFRPTFMAAVPKIWDILKKGVEEGVGKKSPVLQGLISLGFAWRSLLLGMGIDSVLFKLLFGKVFKPILGGRQKVFATGGGPIAGEVQSFIRTMFCAPLLQGYALTETTCAGTVQYINDPRDGVVGPPIGSVELKLRSVINEDGESEVKDRNGEGYLSTDTVHYGEPCKGRGEVLIRGPSVSSGYLKKPEKTAEEFDEDGWFHSGDIAIFTPDGCIKIVDRLKNLVKLKGGEYIAIESMEKEYSKSIYVNGLAGGILCYGDGDMDRPVALVQANLPALVKWASDTSVDFSDNENLCSNKEVEAMVLADLNKEGQLGGVGANEKLIAIRLISGEGSPDKPEINSPWTPENECLTASNKLNRKPIQKAYDAILGPLKQRGIK